MQTLAHLFFPHHTNNFRAKILQPPALFLLAAIIMFFYVAQVPGRISQILGYTAARLPVEKIFELTNKKRTEVGLPPLRLDTTLSSAAQAKGSDMLARDYWAHVSPTGITPWSFFTKSGYVYRYAGENLARDFDKPEEVVSAWMTSPTHRDNLLSAKYDDIGIAVVQGELGASPTTIVVQFLGKRVGALEQNFGPVISAGPPVSPSSLLPEVKPTSGFLVQASTKQTPSPFDLKRSLALGLVGVFIVVLIIDMFVVARRRLVRISGRNLAHFGFLLSIGLMLFFVQRGSIL